MKNSYNHVTIMGRLTRNPEIKQITEARSKTFFTVAVDRHYKKSDGSIETDFIPVSFWGKYADISYHLLKKGSLVLIWGRVQVSSYEKNGEKRHMTEILAENFKVLSHPKDKDARDIKTEAEPPSKVVQHKKGEKSSKKDSVLV